MILTCYGTAAAEAIPGLYCSCAVCENARAKRGREIRARHLSTVDRDIQFDIGPDFFYQINCLGLEPRAIRHLIITHRHSDHLTLSALEMRRHPFAAAGTEPLQVIGSAQTLEYIKKETDDPKNELNMIYTPALPYRPLRLDDDTSLTALPARHIWPDGGAMIYLLERKGKKLLYAHDTGPLFEEVTQWLSARQIDAVSLDCTGVYHSAGSGHMQLDTCEELVKLLKDSGAMKREAICVINHFSHNGGATHRQLEQEALQRGWTAAYDGICVEIR